MSLVPKFPLEAKHNVTGAPRATVGIDDHFADGILVHANSRVEVTQRTGEVVSIRLRILRVVILEEGQVCEEADQRNGAAKHQNPQAGGWMPVVKPEMGKRVRRGDGVNSKSGQTHRQHSAEHYIHI